MIALLAIVLAARAADPAGAPPCPVAALEAAIDAVEAGFVARSPSAVGGARSEAEAALACLAEPLDPALAARWHAAMAMARATALDTAGARAELAALAALPSGGLPDTLLDASPLLRQELGVLRVAGAAGGLLPEPGRGADLRVDGLPHGTLARARPAVVQLGCGDRWITARWEGGKDPGRWGRLFPPTPAQRLGRGLLAGGAGALALAAGTSLAVGVVNRLAFDDPETARAELTGLYERSHTLSYVAAGTGGVALGLGAVTLVAWGRPPGCADQGSGPPKNR